MGSGMGKKLAEVRWGTARKILYGWLLTLPAAALVGGVAAAIALTGTLGLVLVFVALLVGAGTIYAISKRAPVDSANVNDSADVTINPTTSKESVGA
jgi:PiT family inorganic phosphate transporter